MDCLAKGTITGTLNPKAVGAALFAAAAAKYYGKPIGPVIGKAFTYADVLYAIATEAIPESYSGCGNPYGL